MDNHVTSNASITIAGTTLGGAANTSSITLTTANGALNGGNTVLTTNAIGSVTLHTSAGNIGSGTAALGINSPNLKAETSSGDIFLNDIKTGTAAGTITVDALTTTGSVSFSSSGATTFNTDITGNTIILKPTNTTIFNGNIISSKGSGGSGAITITEVGTGTTQFNLNSNPTVQRPFRTIQADTTINISTVGSTIFAPSSTVSANSSKTGGINGVLSIIESTGLLTTGLSSKFIANGDTAGGITLQEKANLAGSGILISGGSAQLPTTISTFVAHPGTVNTFPLPGQISLVIGASIPTHPAAGSNPSQSNISVTVVSPVDPSVNKVYFGSGKLTAPNGNNALKVVGNSAIVFSAGSAAGITLGGNTAITADPPTAAALATPVSDSAADQHEIVSTALNRLSLNSAVTKQQEVLSASRQIDMTQPSLRETAKTVVHDLLLNTNFNANSGLATLFGGISLTGINTTVDSFANAIAPMSGHQSLTNSFQNIEEPTWISETEMTGGIIPGKFVAGNETDIDKMVQGTLVIAAESDRQIKTDFGTVNIAAGSLVLIMKMSNGLALFDLDDLHRRAVTVTSSGRQFELYPGMSVVLTSNAVREFEQINPAQLIAYRSISVYELQGGLKAFSSEFLIPTAVHAVAAQEPDCIQSPSSKTQYAAFA